MRFVADFHIHSYLPRACSPRLRPEPLHQWCRLKGVTVPAFAPSFEAASRIGERPGRIGNVGSDGEYGTISLLMREDFARTGRLAP